VQIAVLTFDGFNEIDSFVTAAMINRVKRPAMRAFITAPSERVTSMGGVEVRSQAPLSFANEADAVVVGSSALTRDPVRLPEIIEKLELDPARQIIAAQCSGALVLAKLGLLANVPACTDLKTKAWVEAAGVEVLDQPFVAHGNVATAGGCLASHYLAAWVISRLASWKTAEEILSWIGPVGQKQEYIERARKVVAPYLFSEVGDVRSR
jgi:transcriptional regulator GlxA family with amidase domain